ncbi:hypothetical protein HDU67_008857 [Dinochytrium kinnereticum]|nr:hypothetical protein HDU67_008857 [Dinochytrium kinnereticum]
MLASATPRRGPPSTLQSTPSQPAKPPSSTSSLRPSPPYSKVSSSGTASPHARAVGGKPASGDIAGMRRGSLNGSPAGKTVQHKLSAKATPSASTISLASKEVKANNFAKPSARLNPKAVNPMGIGRAKTRLQHGSVKHKITWSHPPCTLDYNPLFLTLLEGLRETDHPHVFVVPEALKEMISTTGARDKITPIMSLAVPPLRAALGSREKPVILSAMMILPRLATCLGKVLLPFLATILPPVAPHILSRDAEIRDAVWAALQGLEAGLVGEALESSFHGTGSGGLLRTAMSAGGSLGGGGYAGRFEAADTQVRFEAASRDEVLRVIKSKIPSYTSVF